GHHGHSPSPNLSLTRATRASRACCSSVPWVSISTTAPMPAASIMTPMMLLALTRRSPRDIQTSLAKLPASLVSLADARACRPSLLLMVTVVLIMGGTAGLVLGSGHGDLNDALSRPRQGARHQGVQRLV